MLGLDEARALAQQMSVALLVGTTLVGLAAGGVAFVAVLLAIRARRGSTAGRPRERRAA
jgi:hypothetical protein